MSCSSYKVLQVLSGRPQPDVSHKPCYLGKHEAFAVRRFWHFGPTPSLAPFQRLGASTSSRRQGNSESPNASSCVFSSFSFFRDGLPGIHLKAPEYPWCPSSAYPSSTPDQRGASLRPTSQASRTRAPAATCQVSARGRPTAASKH